MSKKFTPHIHKKRVSGVTSEHKRALVVHNGKVTEKEYLRKLKSDLRHGVLTEHFHNGDIDKLIDVAVKKQEKAKPDPYDFLYAAADIDGKYTSIQIAQLNTKASQAGVKLLLSNPCIEVALSCYAKNVTGNSATVKGAQKEAAKNGMVCAPENKSIVAEKIADHSAAKEYSQQLKKRFPDGIPGTDIFEILDDIGDELRA